MGDVAMGIDALPDALVQHILLQLGAHDLVRIGCANGEWMRLSRMSVEALLSEIAPGPLETQL